MKIFIYKCLSGAFIFFVLFQLTIGAAIKEVEKQINQTVSQENIIKFKNKIRKELNSALKKENYISKEDAILIKNFLEKVKSEIN